MSHSKSLLRQRFTLSNTNQWLQLFGAVLLQGVLDNLQRAYFPDTDPRVIMTLQLLSFLAVMIINSYILAAYLLVLDALDSGHIVDKGFAQQTAMAQHTSGLLKNVSQRLEVLEQAQSVSRQPPATAYWSPAS